VIAKYYTQIKTARLAELLDLSADEVCGLVLLLALLPALRSPCWSRR
jgi:hypothetical protein